MPQQDKIKDRDEEAGQEMKEINGNSGGLHPHFVLPEKKGNEDDENEETKAFLVPNITEVVAADLCLMGSSGKIDEEKGGKGGVPLQKRGSVVRADLGWRRYLGVLYTMLSTNSFSLSSTLLKKYSHINPFNLGVWAFPLAALFSLPFIFYTIFVEKKSVVDTFWPIMKHKKVAFFIWFRAIASVGISYTIILAFKYISVADTRTIMAAAVITVYFCGWIFLGEKCGLIPVIVACLALCGIGVMTRPPILTGAEAFDRDTLIGISFAVGCLLLITIIMVTLRYLQHVHHGILNFLLYAWAFGQSFILAFVTDNLSVPATLMDTFGIASIGLLMALGNLFLVLALQVEEAGVVALIRTSEVIFTFFWQFLLIGVKPDLYSIIGATLVLTGVIVVTLRKWVASLPEHTPTRKKLAFLLL